MPPATVAGGIASLGSMCGVVAVLRRRSTSPPADAGALVADVDAALGALARGPAGLADAADGLEALDGRLRGPAGVRVLATHPQLAVRLEAAMGEIGRASCRDSV